MWFMKCLRRLALFGCDSDAPRARRAFRAKDCLNGSLGYYRSRLLEWCDAVLAKVAAKLERKATALSGKRELTGKIAMGQKVVGERVVGDKARGKQRGDNLGQGGLEGSQSGSLWRRIPALFKNSPHDATRWRERAIELLFILPGILLAITGITLLVLPNYAIVLAAAFFFSSGLLFLVVGFRAIKVKRQFEGLLLRVEGRVSVAASGRPSSGNSATRSPVSSTSLAAIEGLDPKKILYH